MSKTTKRRSADTWANIGKGLQIAVDLEKLLQEMRQCNWGKQTGSNLNGLVGSLEDVTRDFRSFHDEIVAAVGPDRRGSKK